MLNKNCKLLENYLNSEANKVNLSYKDHIMAHYYLYLNFRDKNNQPKFSYYPD